MEPRFSELDSYLFHQGTHYEVYRKLGAHPETIDGVPGTSFAVWAPNARSVRVITDRTGWEEAPAELGVMEPSNSGVWEAFLPEVGVGDAYRYIVEGADGEVRYKSDPYAFLTEFRPANASVVVDLDGYEWGDAEWREQASNEDVLERPMAIYEVHLGSWKRDFDRSPEGFLNYRELADDLADYVQDMGYTHVELMGISEHPFDGSWGYQVTGYYSPTSRHGKPDDFRYLIDHLHRRGIGVILDWVPAHFPKDAHGLARFDGTPLYEYADPLRAEFPEWGTMAFDHGKPEVKSFFISNALYWLNEFHLDALRVDAVYAMLCSNFSRSEWRPNQYGGAENLESFEFFRHVNSIVRERSKGYLIAEDVSSIPGITQREDQGGLGYELKWNMGWMYDTLQYMGHDPIERQGHHEELTHTSDFAFNENFVLEFSHDEVSTGKRSLLSKIPGNEMEQLGGLKTLLTYQFTQPGKKLLFMGQDHAENEDWDYNQGLHWELEDLVGHRDVQDTVRSLIELYKRYPALYSDSRDPATFEWVNRFDSGRNVVSYIRRNPWSYEGAVLVVCNFSPVAIEGYAVGAPVAGAYERLFSTYDHLAGEGTAATTVPLESGDGDCDHRGHCLAYNLRPYESVVFAVPA